MIILVGGEKGLSVIEIEPSGKATNEIRGLVDEMLINKKGYNTYEPAQSQEKIYAV
jgi:hypothetical protein